MSNKSNPFTNSGEQPFGPPLIGALLRLPWEVVQRHMLERLHASGFDDLDTAHLNVFQYPGPQGARPSDLAVRLRISKQALNYLLRELERLDYLERRPTPTTSAPSASPSPHAVPPRSASSARQSPRSRPIWAHQLGPKRFAQLRGLLQDLNQLA